MKKELLLLILLILPSVSAANLKLEVYLDDYIHIGNTYTKLFKITNLDHVTGHTDCINLTLGYNISNITATVEINCLNSWKTANTGEFTPNQTGNYTLCGWIINTTITACKNITVLAQNESIPEQQEEQETQQEQETRQGQETNQDSEIEILGVDEKAKFGETIEVKLRIYRGNTRKYAVYLKLEGAADTAKLYINEKYKNFTFTIPLQIKPNCNKKLEPGKYKLKVEGLDAEDTRNIKIMDYKRGICNKCEECKCKNTTTTIVQNISQETPLEKQLIECASARKLPLTVYKTSDQKAKELIPKLLIATLTILTIILVWRR
jgi:hypothetical protein